MATLEDHLSGKACGGMSLEGCLGNRVGDGNSYEVEAAFGLSPWEDIRGVWEGFTQRTMIWLKMVDTKFWWEN